MAIDPTNISNPSIEKLDDLSTLITIPSFNIDYKFFVDLLKENEGLINNTTNLIVDIRGNTGGNAIYFPLIESYATKNMPASQGLVLASEANLSYFDRFNKNGSKVYGPVVERIKNNMGQIVDGPDYPGRKFKKQKSKIRNVAILTDNGCMSAAESFIIHSKASSDLITLFGSPTGGVIDYTSANGLKLDSGSQNIYFGYPTGTLHKEIPENGFNKNGIQPDMPLGDDIKDKVGYIVEYYKK